MKRFLFLLVVTLLAVSVYAKKTYDDVKISRLVRVIDGDTFVCDIDSFCDIAGKSISIRIRNINTPEIRNKNLFEKKQALIEKERLIKLLTNSKVIELRNLSRCKYFRIVADVYIDNKPLITKLNARYLIKE